MRDQIIIPSDIDEDEEDDYGEEGAKRLDDEGEEFDQFLGKSIFNLKINIDEND